MRPTINEIAGGNPGALTAITEIFDSMGTDYSVPTVNELLRRRLTGPVLRLFYNDHCNGNADYAIATMISGDYPEWLGEYNFDSVWKRYVHRPESHE